MWRQIHTPMGALRAPIPPSHEEELKFIQKTKIKKKQGRPCVFCLCVFHMLYGRGVCL